MDLLSYLIVFSVVALFVGILFLGDLYVKEK